MNKAIIILDAFLYSQERIELFEKALKKIKQLDLPILLISNTVVSTNIQNEVEYFIYDKKIFYSNMNMKVIHLSIIG